MHLAPTTEQQDLKDAVRRFCSEQITPERLASWASQRSGVDEDCWRTVAQLGWFGLGLPASAGGSGLGLVEVGCLLEECGRGLVPRRVINAVRGGVALAHLDPHNPHLPAVARGECVVALAFDERHARPAALPAARVEGDRVCGEKCFVPEGGEAHLQVVSAAEGGGISLLLVASEHAIAKPLRTFDGERQAVLRFDRAVVTQRFGAAGQGGPLLAAVRRQQSALALAEMIGGMDAVLAMTVAYVKEREQFGQKLAVFQAVQHQVADMATAFTASRHLAWQAITRLAAGTEQGEELGSASAFVAQAFKRLTLSAHHLHGGAGYVVEHPLHCHAERAQALCIRYALEAPALAAVAAALLD